MKSKVMDRPMFKQKEDMDPENVGIMSGFKDMDIDELFESEMKEGEGMYDSSAMLERRPDSPEILMNNLRGDMRSVDARREELADMVGYNAAMETPEEVLALLQGSLGGGIGGLPTGPTAQGPAMPPPMPQDAGMMPPPMPQDMGMMSPGMPAQTPPMEAAGMPPLAMAQGGIVQRFSQGSDEDAVTPAETDASSSTLSSEQLRTLQFLINQSRPKTGDLRTAMQERMPIYQELLGGGGRDAAQAQMLFDISGAFLGFAANRGPQGEALKGSPFARFAGATRALPGQIGARASDFAKQEQAVKLAALQSAERDIEMRRTLSAKVALEQAKTAAKAGKVSGSPFNQYQELIIPFVQGISSQADDIRLLNIVTELTKPTVVSTTNKLGTVTTRISRADIPQSFVDGYINKYGIDAFNAWYKSIDPKEELKISPIAFPKITARSPTVEPSGVGEVSPVAPVVRQETDTAEVKTPAGAQQVVARSSLPADDPGRPVLWTVRGYLAGPINTAEAFIARNVPMVGENSVDKARRDAVKANEGLIQALAINDGKVSNDEMQILRSIIGLNPRVFGGEGAMSTALVSIDDALIKKREELTKIVQNPDQYLGRNIAEARMKINLIDAYRKDLGVPQSVFTEKEFQALPVYTEFVDKRNQRDFRVARKDTFSWRNEPAIREFQKNNPGKQYAVILPDNRGVKIFTAPGKTK